MNKRLLSLLMALCLMLSVTPTTLAAGSGNPVNIDRNESAPAGADPAGQGQPGYKPSLLDEGDGPEMEKTDANAWYLDDLDAEVYTLTTEAQLCGLAELVNAGYTFAGKTVKLSKDIELTGAWTPIGASSSNSFQGTFDGGNHTITGLKNDPVSADKYFGLFGYVSKATIQNLTLDGVQIELNNNTSNSGALVAYSSSSTITNVTVSGNIKGKTVGGLIGGGFSNTVTDCAFSGEITASNNAGGISTGGGTFTGCTVDATITGTGTGSAGGISTSGTTFTNCTVSGSITAKGNVGGISGGSSGTFMNCTNNADISVEASNKTMVGGIAVENAKSVENCANRGDITVTGVASAQKVGGIVGSFKNSSYILTDCINTGDVTTIFSAGGIVGYAGYAYTPATNLTITNCDNEGTITSETQNAGGILGHIQQGPEGTKYHFKDCDNSGDVTGQATAGGIMGQSPNVVSLTFEHCTNNANITAKGQNAGGIIGDNNSPVLNIENCEILGGTIKALNGGQWAGGIAGSIKNASSCDLKGCVVNLAVTVTTSDGDKNGAIIGSTGVDLTLEDMHYEGDVDLFGSAKIVTLKSCIVENNVIKKLTTLNLINTRVDTIENIENNKIFTLSADENSFIDTLTIDGNNNTKIQLAEGTKLHVGTVTGQNKLAGGTDAFLRVEDDTSGLAKGLYRWDNSAWEQLVAQVGTDYYTTLSEAIDNAGESGTVTLLADVEEEVTVSNALTIIRNGFTASLTAGTGFALKDTTDAYIIYPEPTQTQTYTIEYQQEDLNGDYAMYENVVTDDVETALNKSYKGFTVKSTTLTGTTYTVQYSRNTYTVTWNTDNGSAPTVESCKYGKPITEPTPEPKKLGHKFMGWNEDIETMPAYDVVFNAKWEESYTIKYQFENLEGGFDESSETVYSKLEAEAALKEEHLGFTRQVNPGFDGNTYTVKYTRKTYEVTWDPDNGDELTTESYKFGAKIEKSADPVKSGYTFQGWDGYSDGMTMPAYDTRFTAQWTKKSSGGGSTTYAVTVDKTTGGSVTVSPKYASKGATVTLTVTPDQGYELDKLTVTDKNGDALKLTDKGDGKYTFTMPSSKVTVNATFAPVVVKPENPFTDVAESAYYYDAVLWAVKNDITSGTTATTFSPNASCTRAQMVTFLWRAAGSPAVTGTNPFTDVKADAYYYDAVLWAVQKGITNGATETTFAPDATVTRGQTVTFLYRNAGTPAASGDTFTDVPADAYYANAVAWAVAEKITNGTSETTFSPTADCTRGQIVTFLYRDQA